MVRLVRVGLVAAVLLAAGAVLPTSRADLDPEAVNLALQCKPQYATAEGPAIPS